MSAAVGLTYFAAYIVASLIAVYVIFRVMS